MISLYLLGTSITENFKKYLPTLLQEKPIVCEGISENGLLLFPNDLCHIYLLKVKKACYFISFYMSEPNIM